MLEWLYCGPLRTLSMTVQLGGPGEASRLELDGPGCPIQCRCMCLLCLEYQVVDALFRLYVVLKSKEACLALSHRSHAADSQDAEWRAEQQQQCRQADCRGRTQRAPARPAAWKLQQPSLCQPVDASGDSDRHAVCLQHDPQTIFHRPRRCSASCPSTQPIRFLVFETS